MAGFFDTDGRLNRGRFAVQYFAFFLPALLFGALSIEGRFWQFDLIAGGIMLFTIFPIIKRFHDLGHSGWWTLTTLIPLVGFVLLIYLLFWRGTVGPNQYGHDPLGAAKNISIRARPVEPAKSLPHSFGTPSTTAQAASHIPANSPPASMPLSHTNTPDSSEESFYAIALSEIQTDSVRPGLWAKAFADSEGDENKCKAFYIRLRVQSEKDRIQQERHNANLAAIDGVQRLFTVFPR